jgi:hypothetical protein
MATLSATVIIGYEELEDLMVKLVKLHPDWFSIPESLEACSIAIGEEGATIFLGKRIENE